MTTAKEARRWALIVGLSGFGVGVPVLLVVVLVWDPRFSPVLAILFGIWLVVLLVSRALIVYQFLLRGVWKQRESARQNIRHLESRIDEAARGPAGPPQGKS